jgi:lysophospholipase L1-like esterase
MILEQNSVFLFQGDSVTDCGRNHNDINSMGDGYAYMVSAFLGAAYPELNIRYINKGVGGNRTEDLVSRWQKDCIDLKPDWVSILIGINDTWRRYDNNSPTPVYEYEKNYRTILQQTKDKTKANLIIMEPFVLPSLEDRKAWREDLDPKIQVARKLAAEFGALYVPLDGLFAAASAKGNYSFWAGDGVHPSASGHALIANALMDTLGM